MLHPNKDYKIDALAKDYKGSVYKLIQRKPELFSSLENAVDKLVMARSQAVLAEFDQRQSIPSPPLSAFILGESARLRQSPLDAALRIRESRQACDFRRWLRQLQIKLVGRTRPGILQVAKELEALQSLTREWAENFDPTLNVTRRRKTGDWEYLLKLIPGLE